MSKVTSLLLAALMATLLAGYAAHAWAQGRIDVRSAITPMGTSSSNGVSFAWFYDSNERTVHVCRAAQGAADGIDCKAKALQP